MNNKKSLLVVLVLLVVAGAFGLTYSKVSLPGKAPGSSTSTTTSNSPAVTAAQPSTPEPNLTAPNPGDKTAPGPVPSTQSGLTADEKAALAAIAPGSKLTVTQQVELANKVAKETGTIDIANCSFDPVILKVKAGQNFTVKNSGSQQATIVFYADNVSHGVVAGGSTTIKATFGNGNGGLFGYYCRVGSVTHESALFVY